MEWNNDSYDDIIVGDRNGYVNYFRRNSNGTLSTMPKVACAGVTIQVDANSAPACVDWDEDGDLDMLLGTQAGNIRLYLNDGGESVPVFTSYSLITSGGSPINLYRCCPQVFDLNGDGRKDLIVGENNAYVYYFENTGTNAAPVFSGSVQLQSAGAPIHEYYGTRLWIYDWNGDGGHDLLTSDYDGYVRVYPANMTGIEEEASPVPGGGFDFSVLGSPGGGLFDCRVVLESPSSVGLAFFSVDGRLVQDIGTTVLGAGESIVRADLTALPCGAYLAVCTAGPETASDRLVIVR